jgi:hypothetical protein
MADWQTQIEPAHRSFFGTEALGTFNLVFATGNAAVYVKKILLLACLRVKDTNPKWLYLHVFIKFNGLP